MFGRHITLKSTEGSLWFYGHLSRKPRYGHLIKRLTYEKPSIQPHILEELLRLAFNPLMEQMNTIISGHDSFFTLMEDIVTVKHRPD
ncbi:hypothetical protein MAM1_0227c08368 [Mucor ambiguus]|uniref:Uncharacterized protein n=1 Tax=Mucor ambiguus TaxID=91626 RepID=A0A0C9MDV9_9FUNG|nr:hypothetical protein MAM1_0227c08368 [Mucor ambiguus]